MNTKTQVAGLGVEPSSAAYEAAVEPFYQPAKETSPQSAGGKAASAFFRKKAEEAYLANPNFCQYCAAQIPIIPGVKIAQTRRKRYCDHRCAARHTNQSRPQREDKPKSPPRNVIREEHLLSHTKQQVFLRHLSWQSARSRIAAHARATFAAAGKARSCVVCGYDTHVQICHAIAVSAFPESATIMEINDPSNLVALCPNHHWEFDHDLLTLPQK